MAGNVGKVEGAKSARLDGAAERTRIHAAIYNAIAKGVLPPGTKLTEDQLTGIFGAPRSRIRDVLQALASDKVVTLHPNRGAFVAEPSVKEARDVFAARKYLEPALAEDIIKAFDKKSIKLLRAHIKKEKAAEKKPDRRSEIKISQDFHLILAEGIGNDVVTSFLEELLARSALITSIYDHSQAQRCSHVSHEHLIDLIERGSPEELSSAMLAHLEEIESELVLVERHHFEVDVHSVLRGDSATTDSKKSF